MAKALDTEWMRAANNSMRRAFDSRDDFARGPYLESIPGIDEALFRTLLDVKQEQPGSSDAEVYEKGAVLFYFTGPRSWTVEAWVVHLRSASGVQKIDWSLYAGRAVLRVLDNDVERARVIDAIHASWPTFCAASARAHELEREGAYGVSL